MPGEESLRTCSACKQSKIENAENFHYERKRKDGSRGFASKCKSCATRYSKRRYEAKRAAQPCAVDGCKNGIHNGKYCATHDRRLRLYGGPLESSDAYKKRRTGYVD